jgi:Pentapeptide repeats (8 copies)
MSNHDISEDEELRLFDDRIQQLIEANTNNFNEITQTLNLDPTTSFAQGDLSDFDLEGANLADADLHQTNFAQANMLDVDLKNSNLKYANLTNTNLTHANLTNTDFEKADLGNADLTDSILSGANLQNVKAIKATFRNNRGLSEADKKILEQQSAEINDDRSPSEEKIRQLIGNFCQHQSIPGTREYNKAAYRLLAAIQKIPGLKRNYQPGLDRQDYDEIFNDTLFEITKKICPSDDPDCFRPEVDNYINSLTRWINYKLRLYYKPKDLIRQNQHKPVSLDRYISEGVNSTFVENITDPLTLNGIDALIEQYQKENQDKVGQKVREYIDQDPDDILKDCKSNKHPSCNCYFLVQQRLLTDPPVSFRELADELDMSMGTLTSYWYKSCVPILQTIANQFENPDESKYEL